MITLKMLESAKVGDSLIDMHYGLKMDEELSSCCQVAEVSVGAATALIERASATCGRSYLNKMLRVVSVDDGGVITCCYVYDGRYAKVVSFFCCR